MNSLAGRTLAITRDEKDAAEFVRLVEAEGGKAIGLPTIRVIPRRDATRDFLDRLRARRYDYCAFMSARTVDILGSDVANVVSALKQTHVIAVGPKTKAAAERLGAKVELTPEIFSSEGIVRMLSKGEPMGKKIIIPRSGAAKRDAADALRELGMEVDEVILYDTRAVEQSEEWRIFAHMLVHHKFDAMVFTSASSVASFFEILGRLVPGRLDLGRLTRVISIGPVTSRELAVRGIKYSEAGEHTIQHTVELAASLLK